MSLSTCFGRWRTTTPARSRFVIRAAPALARSRRTHPTARDRQSRSGATRSRRRDLRTRQHVRSGARKRQRSCEEQGVSVALINPRWIKPIDTGTLEFFARSVEVICTIEDHVLHNGFGCAVMEHLHTPRDQHAGGPHRLARSIHRTRHHSDPAQETRHHRGRAGAKKSCRLLKRKPVAAATFERGLLKCRPTRCVELRPFMSAIEARGLTKVYRTYRKERGSVGFGQRTR